jgi:cytochrome c-type biogenesis protein CcmF
MENLGALSILLALCLGVYALAGSIVGGWRKKPYLIVSAEWAVYSVWFLLTAASALIIHALLASDFRLVYVAAYSNRDMPILYKFAAWWGGQEGSLLLWNWLLACYSAVVVFTNRRKHRSMMPFVTATMMATQVFFLILNAFIASPFKVLAAGREVTGVADGSGLNPLLQHWAMAIHPPMLYLGYIGFVVPFAFAMGSLVTRQPGDAWIHTARRWTLAAWLFQSCGILLGAAWAYAVLGWGGYWNWDPVENASLLPWITATAFLHSVMMQEKRGMLKVWNIVLISATFWLCIFGSFLARSGVVSSVHAFAPSTMGKYFVGFLAIIAAVTTCLILYRLDYLKSDARLESIVSRESSFLFNNLLFMSSCFAILWGTLFPVISEFVTGDKIGVDAPFFNRVNVPIGLLLLFLAGVAPLVAWRRTSVSSLRRNFKWPAIGGLVFVVALLIAGVRHFYALTCFGLCLFVAWTIAAEFYRGSRPVRARTGQNLVAAMLELTHRNTRRYGGYTVHLGVVLMFAGFAGSAFNQDKTVEVNIGDSFRLGRYELKVRQLREGDNPNYSWNHAVIDVSAQGIRIATLKPERRFYKSSQQGSSEAAVRRRLNEDLYLNFADMTNDNSKAVIQAHIFPLVSWIWIGFLILVMGALICLAPSKTGVKPAPTGEVETAEECATVEERGR